jgi:hypothetical protein
VPVWRRRVSAASTPLTRVVAFLVGMALLATGAVAVFHTTNSVGSATLVAAGTVIAALALFGDQLESLEGAGVKIQLRAVASKLEQARLADAAGDAQGAADLLAEAQLLVAAIEPIAARYERIRETTPSGRERTSRLGDLVGQAQEMAKLGFVTADGIEQLFRSGQDGNRIMALGLMHGDPTIASADILSTVIRRPRSNFEQWHALRVSLEFVSTGRPTPEELTEIREAVQAARANGSLGSMTDRSRARLADRILSATTPK